MSQNQKIHRKSSDREENKIRDQTRGRRILCDQYSKFQLVWIMVKIIKKLKEDKRKEKLSLICWKLFFSLNASTICSSGGDSFFLPPPFPFLVIFHNGTEPRLINQLNQPIHLIGSRLKKKKKEKKSKINSIKQKEQEERKKERKKKTKLSKLQRVE